ncbi:MAG TPA: hypothetical protein VEX17_04560 [Bacillales bacterium]|nr:hypothetical protein [Bacillales bacterium]
MLIFSNMAITADVGFGDAKTNGYLSHYKPVSDEQKMVKSMEPDGGPSQNDAAFSINGSSAKGLLVVKVIVNNKDMGNKTSDFNINIHANDPNPISFIGNSNGTNVQLGMGMYSVSQSTFPGYVTTYSSDCFGGIMAAVTKMCVITNAYGNSSSSVK